MRVNSTAVQFRRRGTPSFLLSSRVVDARSMNAPKLTSQPAPVAYQFFMKGSYKNRYPGHGRLCHFTLNVPTGIVVALMMEV